MPLIPANAEIHPILSALIACAAFLDLSDEDTVSSEAAGKVLEQVGAYMHRLDDDDIDAISLDLEHLEAHAKAEKFPAELTEFIRDFLTNCGFVREGDEDEDEDEDDEDGDDEE
jgi:hypothetical protein